MQPPSSAIPISFALSGLRSSNSPTIHKGQQFFWNILKTLRGVTINGIFFSLLQNKREFLYIRLVKMNMNAKKTSLKNENEHRFLDDMALRVLKHNDFKMSLSHSAIIFPVGEITLNITRMKESAYSFGIQYSINIFRI